MSNATIGRIIFYGSLAIIVGLLALRAVPGYLQAQIRSKNARIMNDLRTISTALEAYRADHAAYPQPVPSNDGWTRLPTLLTTPNAYLDSLPIDVFDMERTTFGYALVDEEPERWAPLLGTVDYPPNVVLIGLGPTSERGPFKLEWNNIYDPTNGTVSPGYIHRFTGPGMNSRQAGTYLVHPDVGRGAVEEDPDPVVDTASPTD